MMLPPSERSSNCTLHVTGIPLCACIIIALTLHSALPPRPSSSLDNTKIPPYRRHSLSIPTTAFQVSASPRVVLHLQAVAVGKEGVYVRACVRACVCVCALVLGIKLRVRWASKTACDCIWRQRGRAASRRGQRCLEPH